MNKIKYLPKIKITEDERIWLTEVWKYIRTTGKRPEYKRIRIHTKNQVSPNFNPHSIDTRLINRHSLEITLLGILIIEPNTNIFEVINKIFISIQKLLIEDIEKKDFSLIEVAEDIKVDIQYVKTLFSLVSYYGNFWSSAGSKANDNSIGYETFHIQYDETFDKYIDFTSFEDIMSQYFKQQEINQEQSDIVWLNDEGDLMLDREAFLKQVKEPLKSNTIKNLNSSLGNNKIIGIAINDYQDSKINNLNNCLNDLNALIDILTTKYEFQDIELLTKKEQTTNSFLYARLYDIFINAHEDDSILLLFAGHGEYNSILGTSYWLTYDSYQNDVSTWFNVSNLISFIKASKAKHISLISDSCFAGAIFELTRGGGISAIENKKSRYALTSGGKEKVSDGPIDKLSPFAEALIKTLEYNTDEELSFTTFAENTILNFTSLKSQIPQRGELINVGHEGGSFIFRLKHQSENTEEDKKRNQYQDMRLALGVNPSISIDYDFVIPLFHSNKNFNADYINGAIQEIGYNIIQEVRTFVLENETEFIEQTKEVNFFLEVNYSINIINQKFLSVSIARFDHFGGAHPNNYIYSINFALRPERKITFNDLVDYSSFKNFKEFINTNIEKYVEEEYRVVLKEYSQNLNPKTLDFSFNDTVLTIELLNIMPRYHMAIAFIEIPLDNLKLKIIK